MTSSDASSKECRTVAAQSLQRRAAVYIVLSLAYVLLFIGQSNGIAIIAKALPVGWLTLWALQHARAHPQLALALLCGACGDVLMALDLFVQGLAAFLVGHLAYILLWLSARKRGGYAAAIPVLALLLLGCGFILPAAGDMRLPVAGYFMVIGTMAVLAANTYHLNAWGLLGVYSFLLSDFIIAWNKFVAPLDWSPLAIMVTYYIAQGLIAASVIWRTNQLPAYGK